MNSLPLKTKIKGSSHWLNQWANGIRAVSARNALQFRYTLWSQLSTLFLRPFVYLIAIGYGIGNYVGQVEGKAYIDYFFPALLTLTAFGLAFIETSTHCYLKLTRQKIYQTILIAPIHWSELYWAELLWATGKGFVGCVLLTLAAPVLNIEPSWTLIPSLLVLVLIAYGGAACGFLLMTFAKSHDFLIGLRSTLLIPLGLFSDTYFPITAWPKTLQMVLHLSPLLHGTRLIRDLLNNNPSLEKIAISLGALGVFALIFTLWSYHRFAKRLFQR